MRTITLVSLLLLSAAVFDESESAHAGPPASAPTPPPSSAQGPVRWRGDLQDALREAREQNRPLFVTLRCLPCKQCSAFDKNVLEGGPDLEPLLRQFVTVRLTDAQA